MIISYKDIKDIIKIVKPPEESNLCIKFVSKTIENEQKINKKVDFLVCY